MHMEVMYTHTVSAVSDQLHNWHKHNCYAKQNT